MRSLGARLGRGFRHALHRAARRLRSSRRARGLFTVVGFGLMLALVACVAEQTAPPQAEVQSLPGEPVVRVLLLEGAKQAKLAVDGPCQVVPTPGETLLFDKLAPQVLVPGADGIHLGSRVLAGALECRVIPLGGSPLKLDDKVYDGELALHTDKGVVRAINYLPLEAYTAGVLGGEMPLNWPDSALRAQSIAVRTYAAFQLQRHQSDDHDVARDTRSQVYAGAAGSRARTLVHETEARVLTWDGKVFEAFFHSTCAGHTASAAWVLGVPEIPPLAGASCGHCLASKYSHWTKEVGAAELAKALAPFGVTAPIAKLEAVPWPEGGYVREVHVTHASGETVIEGTKLRRALELKSTSFEVSTGTGGLTVVFAGKGWGHGAGLCQWGAKGCADEGETEDQILERVLPLRHDRPPVLDRLDQTSARGRRCVEVRRRRL